MHTIERQVLIGGTGRSGTSVLSKIFSLHPAAATFVESWFLSPASPIVKFLGGQIKEHEINDLWEEFLEPNNLRINYFDGHKICNADKKYMDELLSEARLRQIVSGIVTDAYSAAGAFEQAIEAIFSPAMESMGKSILVEKTPRNLSVSHLVCGAMREMVFIHILRDPKDVCCSVLQQSWGPNSVDEFCAFYADKMSVAKRSYNVMSPKFYLPISFEELVANPVSETRRILRFTNIDDASYPFDLLDDVVSRDSARIGRYKNELTPSEAGTVDDACRPLYEYWKSLACRYQTDMV